MASRPGTQSGDPPSSPARTSEPPKPVHLPLCISFRWRCRQVLCTPLWDDAGRIAGLTYPCPQCGQRQSFRQNALVGPRVGLSIEGCVRCLSPGCGLHLVIVNGEATDVPAWCL